MLKMILAAVQSPAPEVRRLSVLNGEMTRRELKDALGLKDDEHFRKALLLPALEAGWIEMAVPDKPRSSRQRYRLTGGVTADDARAETLIQPQEQAAVLERPR